MNTMSPALSKDKAGDIIFKKSIDLELTPGSIIASTEQEGGGLELDDQRGLRKIQLDRRHSPIL